MFHATSSISFFFSFFFFFIVCVCVSVCAVINSCRTCSVCYGYWLSCSLQVPLMSLGSFLIDLESFDVSTLTVTFSSGGQLRITCADPNYNIATRTNKRENRVFPIFSAELDGGYSKFQSSGQLPGSKCFMGRLLEKALLVFVKSKVCSLIVSGMV